jgi:hypothetical protein
MLVSNAKQTSFCTAVARTFDGDHPCSLCHVVSKGASSEHKPDAQVSGQRLDLICVTGHLYLQPRVQPFEFASRQFFLMQVIDSPPAPPPRCSLGWEA